MISYCAIFMAVVIFIIKIQKVPLYFRTTRLNNYLNSIISYIRQFTLNLICWYPSCVPWFFEIILRGERSWQKLCFNLCWGGPLQFHKSTFLFYFFKFFYLLVFLLFLFVPLSKETNLHNCFYIQVTIQFWRLVGGHPNYVFPGVT